MSKKNRSRLLAVTALSGVASLIGAGGAQAQQIILDQDGPSRIRDIVTSRVLRRIGRVTWFRATRPVE